MRNIFSNILGNNLISNSNGGGGVDPISPVGLAGTFDLWIDASDYAVGPIANGSTITNKGSGGNFTVAGTTLSVQINDDGKKEFVFDGATRLTTTNSAYFVKFHNLVGSYSLGFIGKIGITSNPDAFYGICGSNGGSSAAHGFFLAIENRVAQPATQGLQQVLTKAVGGSTPISSNTSTPLLKFNTRTSIRADINTALVKDLNRFYIDGDLVGIHDRVRTTVNTDAGLGTVIAPSATNPTQVFQIGAMGNNVLPFIGKIEQITIHSASFTIDQIRGLDSYFGFHPTFGKSNKKYLSVTQTITDQYTFGANYFNTLDNKRILWSNRGPSHVGVNAHNPVQSTSIDEGASFSAFVNLDSDANSAYHHCGGGLLPTGEGLLVYPKLVSGAFAGMFTRRTSDFATYTSEVSITLPTTSPALSFYAPHDTGVLAANGDLMIPFNAYNTAPLYNIYALRVSDNGTTFSYKLIFSSSTEWVNESSLARIGESTWILVGRFEAANNIASPGTYRHRFFRSDDDGETWSPLGSDTLTAPRRFVACHPPQLRTFMLNGQQILKFSFVDRGERRWYAIYCLASEFLSSGVTALNNKTVYTFDHRLYGASGAGGPRSGYPCTIHRYNDIREEGVYFAETVNDTTTTVNLLKVNGEHGATVAAELGI